MMPEQESESAIILNSHPADEPAEDAAVVESETTEAPAAVKPPAEVAAEAEPPAEAPAEEEAPAEAEPPAEAPAEEEAPAEAEPPVEVADAVAAEAAEEEPAAAAEEEEPPAAEAPPVEAPAEAEAAAEEEPAAVEPPVEVADATEEEPAEAEPPVEVADAAEEEPATAEAPAEVAAAAEEEPATAEVADAVADAAEEKPAAAEAPAEVAAAVAAEAAEEEPAAAEVAAAEEAPVEAEPPAEVAAAEEKPAEAEAPPAPAAPEEERGVHVAAPLIAAGGPKAGDAAALAVQRNKRRRLLFGLGALVLLLLTAGAIFGRYLLSPEPLPDLLPMPVNVNYRPHYLFSIYGVEQPSGVAVSPDGKRLYVTESGGERRVKIFDRDGSLVSSFAPLYTEPAERAPVYVAVDPAGRVFVTDRLQHAVFVHDADGRLLDALIGPDLTLREYASKHGQDVQPDGLLAYNLLAGAVLYQAADGSLQKLPAPDPAGWAPLGVRLDAQGAMWLTNVADGQHTVHKLPAELIQAAPWQEFDPPVFAFGAPGQGNGELMFPNVAVADSLGRIYVTDGNNGRISVWDELGTFLFAFGRGVGEGALSLPRGAAIDGRDRLHIADAVQQGVKVYDVSGQEPEFLYAFGDWGTEDGQFSYPVDIALDGTGRLYIADRENNRLQVWSY